MSWSRPPPGVNPQYSSHNYAPGGFAPPTGAPRPDRGQNEYKHRPGVPAGGWDEDEEPIRLQRRGPDPVEERRPTTFPASTPNDPRMPPSFQPPRPQVEEPRYRIQQSEQPGIYERKLIEDITQPGGVRPRPSDKDLSEFSSKCKYLSCEVVMDILSSVVLDQPRSLKALYVIDKVVSEYDNFRDTAKRYIREISSASHSPGHMRILQPLLSKLGGAQPSGGTEELLLFQYSLPFFSLYRMESSIISQIKPRQMERLSNITGLSKDSVQSSLTSQCSFLIQTGEKYTGLPTRKLHSRFNSLRQNPLYKFPMHNQSISTKQGPVFNITDFSLVDAIDMHSSLTQLRNRSPFNVSERQKPPQNSMESISVGRILPEASSSYLAYSRPSIDISEEAKEAILQIQKNFVLKNTDDRFMNSISPRSSQLSFFSDEIVANSGTEIVSFGEALLDGLFEDDVPDEETESRRNYVFLDGFTASKFIMSSCPEFPVRKNLRPDLPDGASPLYRKIVVCQSDEPKQQKVRVEILASIPVCGYPAAPSIIYSKESLASKGVINHSQSSSLTLLLTGYSVRSLLMCQIVWISCGFEHCLAVTGSGKVLSWGYGASGCLGHGNRQSYELPTPIDMLSEIVYAQCGAFHSVAITKARSVYMWGRNDVNQLGISQHMLTQDSQGFLALSPMKHPQLQNIIHVSCGEAHTLALDARSSLFALGYAQEGQLGVLPRTESGIHKVQGRYAKAVAGGLFSAGLTDLGQVYTWGNGVQGQLGLGKRITETSLPKQVGISETIVDLVCGEAYVLCLSESGKVFGWGRGIAESFGGEFEDGSEIVCFLPRELSALDIAHRMLIQIQSII